MNELIFSELSHDGARGCTAAADQIGHFLVGQLGLETDALLVRDAVGLAQR